MKTLAIKMMILIPGLVCTSAVNVSTFAQSKSSVWDGIYSEEQAKRGVTVYQEVCAACHGVDLRGDSNSPSLIGVSFMFLWEHRSLGELLTKIQTEMPPANPNSLPSENYVDILAYVMQVNSFPAGKDKLSDEPGKYDQILITGKP